MTDMHFFAFEFLTLSVVMAILIVMVVRLRRDMDRRFPIERYARCSLTFGGFTIEPGIEWRGEDDLDVITAKLEYLASLIARRCQYMPSMDAVKSAEIEIAAEWPGRAWFVEVHDATRDRWCQIFQPFGVPQWKRTDDRARNKHRKQKVHDRSTGNNQPQVGVLVR